MSEQYEELRRRAREVCGLGQSMPTVSVEVAVLVGDLLSAIYRLEGRLEALQQVAAARDE